MNQHSRQNKSGHETPSPVRIGVAAGRMLRLPMPQLPLLRRRPAPTPRIRLSPYLSESGLALAAVTEIEREGAA